MLLKKMVEVRDQHAGRNRRNTAQSRQGKASPRRGRRLDDRSARSRRRDRADRQDGRLRQPLCRHGAFELLARDHEPDLHRGARGRHRAVRAGAVAPSGACQSRARRWCPRGDRAAHPFRRGGARGRRREREREDREQHVSSKHREIPPTYSRYITAGTSMLPGSLRQIVRIHTFISRTSFAFAAQADIRNARSVPVET